jgi:hypothetical protein
VLNPAIFGEILFEFLLRASHRRALGAEHNGAAAGGALVDGKKVLGHLRFLVIFR